MTNSSIPSHASVVVVGGGQAGLAQAAEAERRHGLTQLARAGDVAVPRVERDADFKPLVRHWYVVLRAEDRCHGFVVPDVRPDTDR